jgi:phytoene dehydrogenase-like protein
MKEKKITIIGSGFSALSAASFQKQEVVVYEKMLPLVEEQTLKKDGFTFDMAVGTGCRCFDRFFADLVRRQLIIMTMSHSCL